MGISNLIRTEIDLTTYLSDVPESSKQDAIDSIGGKIVKSIKDYLSDGESPVDGYDKFEKLSLKYAEKKGSDLPNLYLEGDLWKSLGYERKGDTLIIGVDSSQEGKADGHSNFSGDSKLPLRRFIADEGEEYKEQQSIIDEVIPLYETGVQSAIEELTNITKIISISNIEKLNISGSNKIKKNSGSSITLEGITEKDILKLFKRK
jgi:hypothetical protein